MRLHLDVAGTSEQITGTVADNTFVAEVLADRAVYSGSRPCPVAGKYNCLLVPTVASATVPQGDGYATLTVVASGNGVLAGTLADGTAINVTMPVSKHGTWPLYKLLYANKGDAIGWLSIIASNNTVAAVVDWIKPIGTGRYAAGFSTVLTLQGTKYPSPAVAGRWQLTLGQGNLPSNVVKTVTISTTGAVTLPPVDSYKLSLKVTSATGKFTGSFVYPGTRKVVSFTGLFLQPPEPEAGGFFLGPSASGFVTLEP